MGHLARAIASAVGIGIAASCFGQATPLGKALPIKPAARDFAPCKPDANGRVHPACTPPARVQPHEPIYAVLQKARGDDRAIRLHYSVRYLFLLPDCGGRYRDEMGRSNDEAKATDAFYACVEDSKPGRREIYAMYTGEFDFYWGSRPSGPVINRISNPGLHYRRYLGDFAGHGLKWYDLGVEHRSNGQTTDPLAAGATTTYRAEEEYLAGNRAYLDSISQDTNFVVAEVKHNVRSAGEDDTTADPRVQLYARWKPFYFSNDTAVTWGPRAADNPPIADYDRFRFSLAYRIGRRSRFYADWTLGDRLLKTDSLNLGFHFPIKFDDFILPLYFRAHFGPLYALADFTRSDRALGFGILLLADH